MSVLPSIGVPRRFRFGLGTKFVVLVAAILAATMTTAAYISASAQSEALLAHLRAQGETLGEYIAATSHEPILARDLITLGDNMHRVSKQPNVVFGVILGEEQRPLTNFLDIQNDYIQQAIAEVGTRDATQAVQLLSANPHLLVLNYPIMFSGKSIGTVVLGLDREPIDRRARQILLRQMAFNLAIILVLAVLIYVVFRVYALRPIAHLIDGSMRVAKGDLALEVAKFSNDELGRLADSFNHMTKELRSSIEQKDRVMFEMRELNKSLEAHVAERTRDLQLANQNLEYLALHDPLTRLPNRALLIDRLNQAVFVAQREQKSFALTLMDLDRFKELNDTLGHAAGDLLLQMVATRVSTVLRKSDTFARLGGDEFAVILNGVDESTASSIIRKVLATFEEVFRLEGNTFSCGCSLGIVIFPVHGDQPSVLLQRADVAMYYAKRNQLGYAVYDPKEDQNSPSRLMAVNDLRLAIENGGLELYYQPQINVMNGDVVGAEALVRWRHPTRGMVFPDQFIPMAEQSGLIDQLTQYVLDIALHQHSIWTSLGYDLKISVNLSPRNLREWSFPDSVGQLLRKHTVDSSSLVLEITEGAVMENPERSLKILNRLDQMGVGISIDDFGTGYSSLTYLRRFPVDEIKIDKSFVIGMDSNHENEVIVQSIVDMARNLGLRVVAEGVETSASLEQLRGIACSVAQGYFFSVPKPAGEFTKWLEARAATRGAQRV